MKSILLIGSLTIAQQTAPAAADPVCNDIRALADAAREANPFRSLRDRNFTPRFGRMHCFFSSAGGYTCGHNLANADETAETYAARIHSCLPGSVRRRGQGRMRLDELVRAGPFQARIVERGTDRSHVGRTINIYFSLVTPTK